MTTSNTEGLSLAEFMAVHPTDDPKVFVGATEQYGMLGIYGGHFLGQALAAGFETVEQAKLAHSFHAYFLRKGDPEARLEYHVESLRDGYGSDVRSITARQNGDNVFHMIASFKLHETGEEHQKTAPEVASPEELIAARTERGDPPSGAPTAKNDRADILMASAPFHVFEPGREPVIRTWMKVNRAEDLSDRMKQVVLAFLADGTLMFNSLIPYGVPFETHRLTSLDQSVWFHRMPEPSEWMLFDQRSTAAAGARGLNEGEIYARDGALLLTCSQESMLRAN